MIIPSLATTCLQSKTIPEHWFDTLPEDDSVTLIKSTVGKKLAGLIKFDIAKGPWIAGGMARNIYHNRKECDTDWDIYFANREQYAAVSDKIMQYMQAASVTENATSYHFNDSSGDVVRIQLIYKSFFSTPEKVINDFDFTVCQYITDGKSIIVGKSTLVDEEKKLLKLVKESSFRSNIFNRIMKYRIYGYYISDELAELIKNNKNNIDWTNTDAYS